MKDFLQFFAPRRLLYVIGQYFSYSLKAFFRFWFLSLLTLIVIHLALFLLSQKYHYNYLNIWLWIISLLPASIPGFILLYRNESHTHTDESAINIGATEIIKVNEKEFLALDLDSQRISLKQKELFSQLAKKTYPFRTGLVHASLLQHPQLFYAFHDLNSLRHSIKRHIQKKRFSSILMITKDNENKRVEFDVLNAQEVIDADFPTNEFKYALNGTIEKTELLDEYIVEVTRIHSAIHGQSITEMILSFGKFDIAHQIINDCETLFINAAHEIKKLKGENNIQRFEVFEKSFLSNFERYRGIVLLNQGQYLGAIRHTFKAIELCPFFPYTTYRQFRDAFNRRYLGEVNLKTIDAIQIIDDNIDKQAFEETKATRTQQSQALFDQNEFPRTPSFDDILKEIMIRAGSEQINVEIEKKLSTNFCESPVREIIHGEVIKYIAKGTKMHEKMYLERINESIQDFETVLSIDPDFILMHSRIGVLKIIYSLYETDEHKQKQLLDEGAKSFAYGADLYAQLGLLR